MTNTTFSTSTIVFIFLCLITFGIAATVAFNQNKEIGELRSQNQALTEKVLIIEAKNSACIQETKTCIETRTIEAQTYTTEKANLVQGQKVLEDANIKVTAENLKLKTQLASCAPTNPNGTNAPGASLPTNGTHTPPAADKAETQPWLTIFSSAAALLTILYTTARKWNDHRSNQITVRMDRSTFAEYVRYMRSR